VVIDRVSKFTYVEFHDSAGKMEGSAFLRNVIEAFPYQIHIVLTDSGMAFADLPKNRDLSGTRLLGPHIFDRVCDQHSDFVVSRHILVSKRNFYGLLLTIFTRRLDDQRPTAR
jgi:hypothetical protein